MSWKDIDKKVLADVIDGLGKEFTTWDVLADARVRAAHPDLTSHSHFNAFVGRAISEFNGSFGIPALKKTGRRNNAQVWRKI